MEKGLNVMIEKVMITGAEGFIGNYVTKLLDNYEVINVNENVFEINWNTYMEKYRPDYIINLAWRTGKGYLDDYENVQFVRTGLSMYEAFYKYGGKRAVFVGTEQEYKRENRPLKESDTVEPISLYAECKADLGKILVKDSLVRNHGFVWCRLFFIYGPGEKKERLMPSMIAARLKGEDVKCSYGGYVRDYIYVKDVASAIVKCLFSDYTGYVNVGGGEQTTIKDIGDTISELIPSNGRISYKTMEESPQPLNISADISVLKSLGWKKEYSLREGLREEINEMMNSIQ